MDLTHRFSVPARIDEAWNAFNDLERLAPCFPGATISSITGDEFAGSVKIKLGPISLVYNGSGRFVERNDTDRQVVIEARGKDKRGNGTATARVTASFAEDGEETEVEVLTELAAVPAADEVAAAAPVADNAPPLTEPAPSTAPQVSAPTAQMPPRGPEESTVDVLRTIGPVLLKRYGPALAVFGLLLFIVIKIIRRKS